MKITPTVLPLGGSTFTFNYSFGTPYEDTFNTPTRGEDGELHLQLAHTNVIPKTVEIEFNSSILDYTTQAYGGANYSYVSQVPSGWISAVTLSKDNGSGSFTRETPLTGTITYSTGELVFQPDHNVSVPKVSYTNQAVGSWTGEHNGSFWYFASWRSNIDDWEYVSLLSKLAETGAYVKVRYRADASPNSAENEEHSIADIKFDLTDHYVEYIVPNSVRFHYGNHTYFDSDGYLYHSLNAGTGAATQAGTINYTTGGVTVTDWTSGASNSLSLQSLLTQIQVQISDYLTFRTPGAPIRPGSLYVQCNQLDGTLISETDAMDGTIKNSDMDGTVDYLTGLVDIRFGQWVTPTGHEAEVWYDADAIDPETGKIFMPKHIFPDTVKFNCVVLSFFPLSSDVLGLDPVRLPYDGKVLIFKEGDVVVVHNTDSVACNNPLVAGTVIDVGRERLSYLEARDTLGAVLDPALYTEDLDAGTCTFADPLDLSDYTQPIYVYHTVEDMVLCTDVEISGRLTINKMLSHNYDKDNSYVSSALIMKIDGEDLFARWSNPFTQQTWTSVWSNTRIGNAISAQYDYNTHPLVVTNKGTITQRWALVFTSSSAFNIIGETLRTHRYWNYQ